MVRIIERSTVKTELFDKLFKEMSVHHTSVDKKVFRSIDVLMAFARSLRMGVVPSLLMAQMQGYCDRYPYTMLVNR